MQSTVATSDIAIIRRHAVIKSSGNQSIREAPKMHFDSEFAASADQESREHTQSAAAQSVGVTCLVIPTNSLGSCEYATKRIFRNSKYFRSYGLFCPAMFMSMQLESKL